MRWRAFLRKCEILGCQNVSPVADDAPMLKSRVDLRWDCHDLDREYGRPDMRMWRVRSRR